MRRSHGALKARQRIAVLTCHLFNGRVTCGFRASALGFRVAGSGFRVKVAGLAFRVWGLRSVVYGLGSFSVGLGVYRDDMMFRQEI